jgi:peptide/nickel transport system substrate-binding protein
MEGLLRIVSAPSSEWAQIDFGIEPVTAYRRADFFGDVRVRQAIAQCIDRWSIVDEVTYGRGVALDSYLPPQHPLFAGADISYWDYDPAAGQALLEEVGWLDDDEDGVREARGVQGVPNGTQFEVALLVPADHAAQEQVARIVKANLADCGIRVTLETLPLWELLADGPDGRVLGRQFDLVQTTRRLGETSPCGHYLSSEIPDRGRWYGENASGYSSPAYDDACQRALWTLPGAPGYEAYHTQAQVIFSGDLVAVPLFSWLRVAVARPGVLNLTLDSTAPSELWNIEQLDVDLE